MVKGRRRGGLLPFPNSRQYTQGAYEKKEYAMRACFACSFFHRGLPGGWLTVDDRAVTYQTGKLTVEKRFRRLVMDREEIRSVSRSGRLLPVVRIEMKNGESFRFLVFSQKRFLKCLEERGRQEPEREKPAG